ncbi:hypothetical protein QFZ30_001164 [Arthrobacter pascens]|nr:hypothetical protein [Arthrobacter pascens]
MQIAEYVCGNQRIVQHVGSAHTEAKLGGLLQRAVELLNVFLTWVLSQRRR